MKLKNKYTYVILNLSTPRDLETIVYFIQVIRIGWLFLSPIFLKKNNWPEKCRKEK